MGVDGCRGGWLIAKTEGDRDDFSTVSLSVVPTLAQALKGKALKGKALKEKALEKRGFKEKALIKKGLEREALNKKAVREKATKLVLIDMPKGLLSDKARKVEGLARQLLKGQASTVFNVPVVDAVFAGDYQDASAINYRMTGKNFRSRLGTFVRKFENLTSSWQGNLHSATRSLSRIQNWYFASWRGSNAKKEACRRLNRSLGPS